MKISSSILDVPTSSNRVTGFTASNVARLSFDTLKPHPMWFASNHSGNSRYIEALVHAQANNEAEAKSQARRDAPQLRS